MDSAMWDARYGEAELVWGAEPNRFLPPVVEGLDPGTAIDLACGEGRNAIWLARNGWAVTGVDFSPTGIEKARLLAEDTDVDWVVADVTTFRPGRMYDLVIIFYLHLGELAMASTFANAIEALAPGGTLFGVGHALRNLTDGYGGPPSPEILWTAERIGPLVTDLEVVELGERLRPVEAADTHAVDLVLHARKRRPIGP
jgi:SAM-dependent methyltransferase